MARRKKKILEKKRRAFDLDITSLLDILVILLVFLLKNYSASELKVNLVESLALPTSESRDLGKQYVLIQVNSKGVVFIENEKIGVVRSKASISLPFLAKALKTFKKDFFSKNRAIASVEEKKEILKRKTRVNLLFDHDTPYNIMNKVMNTTAESGFGHFKFIVRSNY